MIFGDHGVVVFYRESGYDGDIYSVYPTFGGADTIFGGTGADIIIGGSGGVDQAAPALLQGLTRTVDAN
ncbi:hypothetical protein RZS08_55095, partial [Arthrospira platensis SPKY1]|nr:hypothetical protein [Arthrospira platensis SPKY1]